MMEQLPDLHTLTDEELKELPKQLQDITFKALDGFGAELEAGNLTLEKANAKSDQMMQWTTAQQELISAERMRRSMIILRKRSIIRWSITIVAVLALLAITVLDISRFIDAL